jgi:uncharacterized membrane protein
MTPDPISTGLPPRVAAPLTYAGWWITGVIFWHFERRNGYVRFHAAQSCVVFGAIALVVAVLAGIAGASVVYNPPAVRFWSWTTAIVWGAGLVLWLVAMWQAAAGRLWRIPVAAHVADWLCRQTDEATASSAAGS